MAMVEEVRRQFRTIPGIMEGTGKPEYDKCVAISTEASLKKMMLPGAITIISPILIGFLLGPEALGGFLAGATVSGVLMGIFQTMQVVLGTMQRNLLRKVLKLMVKCITRNQNHIKLL
jgi:K(+)-stimulated pyrophosphate-energized sodium pump